VPIITDIGNKHLRLATIYY